MVSKLLCDQLPVTFGSFSSTLSLFTPLVLCLDHTKHAPTPEPMYISAVYQLGHVQIFCACVTNYHKLSSLKTNTHLVCHSSVDRCPARLGWVLCSGYHKPEIKMLAGLRSHLEALGRNPLPSSLLLTGVRSLQL